MSRNPTLLAEGQGPKSGAAGQAADERRRYVLGRRAANISIYGNIGLGAAKALMAWWTNSIALWADTVHTASDSITSIVVLLGLRIARRPADKDHPFGHGRAETVATLVIAVLLAVVGVKFGQTSIERMVNPVDLGVSAGRLGLVLVAAAMLVAAVLKEWMARYAQRIGKLIDNTSLEADAWHHRSDALASVLVAMSMILTVVGWGRYGIDGVLGLVISAIILYTAWGYLRDSASTLLGHAPRKESVDEIARVARAVHGVQDVHEVAVHDYGPRKVASLHIRLMRNLALEEAHRVASEVEKVLTQQLGVSALVHAEPDGEASPMEHLEHIRDVVQRLLSAHPAIVSFHALDVQPEDHGLEVEFHVNIPPATPIESAHKLEHDVRNLLTAEFPKLHVHVHVEPCRMNCTPCPGTCGVSWPAN